MTNARSDAPSRGIGEIGTGDFVKIGSEWKEVSFNSAQGTRLPKSWTIRTTDGGSYDMFDVNRYAKAEDMV